MRKIGVLRIFKDILAIRYAIVRNIGVPVIPVAIAGKTKIMGARYSHMCHLNRSIEKFLFVALCLWTPFCAYAQNPPPQSTHRGIEFTALVGAGYPTASTGGLGIVIGTERIIGGRYQSRQLKGIAANFEVGPGGLTGRVGWTNLFRNDAGADGLSFEAVYLRPWQLKWGVERNKNWFGPGVTYRVGYARISGASVFRTSAGSWHIAPSVTLGLVFPLK